MISKFLIIAAIVGLFPSGSNQVAETALISGLEYALTQPNIVDSYGQVGMSDKEKCKKVVVVNSSKNMDKATAAHFKESDICVAAMEKQDMFFFSITEYFEIENFSSDDNGYTLSLQVVSPDYNTSSKKQMLWVLKYGITDELINVQSFDQVVRDN